MGLITILPGTEVDANDLDFNFKELEQQISAGLEEINNLVEHTTYSLTALQNQIVDNKNTSDGQNSSLTESLNTVSISKLDANLSNIGENLNTTSLNKILNYILPDTQQSSAYSINSGFVAPCDGWVYVNVRGYSNGRYNIYINDYELVNNKADGGLCSASLSMLIRKGDKVTFSANSGKVASFRPTVTKIEE